MVDEECECSCSCGYSVCVLVVFAYWGEGWGDDYCAVLLFFDVEVVVVACYEDVGVCYSFVGSSHGLFFPPVPYGLCCVACGFGYVSVCEGDDLVVEVDACGEFV